MNKLPRLFFTFDSNQNILIFEFSDFNVTLNKFENRQHLLYIVGNPIINKTINHKFIWEKINKKISYETIKNIDGEFLIIHHDKKNKSINIFNDRFTSIPLFYLKYRNKFIGSVFYKEIKNFLEKNNDLKISKEAVFEFLWLQRLIGEKTYDSYSKCLMSATHLIFCADKINTYSYWNPSFKKSNLSINDSADILKDLLFQSILKKNNGL